MTEQVNHSDEALSAAYALVDAAGGTSGAYDVLRRFNDDGVCLSHPKRPTPRTIALPDLDFNGGDMVNNHIEECDGYIERANLTAEAGVRYYRDQLATSRGDLNELLHHVAIEMATIDAIEHRIACGEMAAVTERGEHFRSLVDQLVDMLIDNPHYATSAGGNLLNDQLVNASIRARDF